MTTAETFIFKWEHQHWKDEKAMVEELIHSSDSYEYNELYDGNKDYIESYFEFADGSVLFWDGFDLAKEL